MDPLSWSFLVTLYSVQCPLCHFESLTVSGYAHCFCWPAPPTLFSLELWIRLTLLQLTASLATDFLSFSTWLCATTIDNLILNSELFFNAQAFAPRSLLSHGDRLCTWVSVLNCQPPACQHTDIITGGVSASIHFVVPAIIHFCYDVRLSVTAIATTALLFFSMKKSESYSR